MCDCLKLVKARVGCDLVTAEVHHDDGGVWESFRVHVEGRNLLPSFCPYCGEVTDAEVKKRNDEWLNERPSGA